MAAVPPLLIRRRLPQRFLRNFHTSRLPFQNIGHLSRRRQVVAAYLYVIMCFLPYSWAAPALASRDVHRHAFGMFVITEADAAAIRATFDQEGELSSAIGFRRRFPGITDNTKARACARSIAGWLADAAAEAARATIGIKVAATGEAVLLAPEALAEASDGAETRVGWLGAAVSAQQLGRQQRQGV